MASTKKDEAPIVESEKEKMVRIRIPITKEEKGDVFASVNERTWLIQRGVDVEVPECVVEVLRHKEDMQVYALEYENKVASK